MIFSATVGAAVAAGYWYLWLAALRAITHRLLTWRSLDRQRDAAVTSPIPALSCRSYRPNASLVKLVRLSRTSLADEMPRNAGDKC
jgi:hypothetical protein